MPKLSKKDKDVLDQVEMLLRALPQPARLTFNSGKPVMLEVSDGHAGEALTLWEAVERANP